MVSNFSVSLDKNQLTFFILGLLKDPDDLIMAQMLADSLDYSQAETIVKYKLTGINPYTKMLPKGTKCWMEPKNANYIQGSFTKEEFILHESMRQGYIPVFVDRDDDFSSGYVNVILPPIEGEKCTTTVLRSCLIIDEEFDLSRNQTDESEEELGPF